MNSTEDVLKVRYTSKPICPSYSFDINEATEATLTFYFYFYRNGPLETPKTPKTLGKFVEAFSFDIDERNFTDLPFFVFVGNESLKQTKDTGDFGKFL
jgi:hypothetical protein